MHSRRLVSHKNIYNIIKNSKDFYIRSHGFNPIKAIYWLCIIVMVTFFLMYCTSGILTADLSKYSLDNLAVSMIVMGIIFLLLIFAATYLIYRMQRMLIITEFQNLLFASAMREKTAFYAIISKESVIYADANCADHIGESCRKLNMEEFLSKIGLDESQIRGCINSLEQNRAFSARCLIDAKELFIDLAPLERPNGFFSIAAREKQSNN